MAEHYQLAIAGLVRDLPWRKINDTTEIALFQLLGDVELARAIASELYGKMRIVPDLVVAPEVKAIPLAHELAALLDCPYLIVRKAIRSYVEGSLTASATSFTNRAPQTFYLDEDESRRVKGRTAAVVDDVATTGATLAAVGRLIDLAGGTVGQTMVAVIEGDANLPEVCAIAQLPEPRRPVG